MSSRKGFASGWHEYPTSQPRKVEGGLQARATRGSIGSTWWSRRFVDVLESFALGTRLTRGRNYARRGQVLSLDVAPGEVRAWVQGSRPRPYNVLIALAQFSEAVWSSAETAFAEQALPSAKLLAGEVPPELEAIFADAGAPLFPRAMREMDLRCSCPDVEVPCKHIAATFYLLAEAFDDDPFLLLRWRGRSREQLLERVRGLRLPGGEAGSVEPGSANLPVAGTARALSGLSNADPEADRFWLPPPPLPPRPPVLDAAPDLLMRQLPTPPAGLGGQALVEVLTRVYTQFGRGGE